MINSENSTSVGMSATLLATIDPFLQYHYIDTGKLPCAQLLVARHGVVVHQSSLGMADVERTIPLADDSLFRIYSMTKPLTSLAVMMLVEQGKLRLDDPVCAYIPSWKTLGVYSCDAENGFHTTKPQRPMQIIDLLRHTAGLTYGFQHSTAVDAAYRARHIGEIAKDGTLETMIDQLSVLPLDYAPGSAWTYSVATDVLGYLVGLISGQRFEDFIKTHITGPLDMADTDFQVNPSQAHRLTACYQATQSGGIQLQDDPATSAYLKKPEFISGGGGLVSTSSDYLKFCQMILNGGTLNGHQYVTAATLAIMCANQLPNGHDLAALARGLFSESDYTGIGFGLGFATLIDTSKTTMAGSGGSLFWGGMASTFFWIDPALQLIGIFMTQLIPSSTYQLRREIRRMVYAAVEA